MEGDWLRLVADETRVAEHNGGPAARLFATCLWIEYHAADGAEFRDRWSFLFHGGKTSRPKSAPQSVAGCKFSGVTCASRSSRFGRLGEGFTVRPAGLTLSVPGSPSLTRICFATARGMRRARLLPHF